MRAFVVGNATIDESFAVDCLPQPGESITATVFNRCLGGKGANQAIILSRCGIDTTFITTTADDQRGQDIRQWLNQEQLNVHNIQANAVASDQSLLFSLPDGENSVISTTACVEQLTFDTTAPLLTSATSEDSLILQGNLSYQTTHDLLRYAADAGIHTHFNPSPVQSEFIHLWPLVDVVFLNATEVKALTEKTGTSAVQHLLDQGVGQVVLTHGESGVWSGTSSHTEFIPAEPTTVVDTTGAGDTFMSAAIGSAQSRSTGIDRLALQHAHRAAAITVSRPGTVSAFPTQAELMNLLFH